jgi:hypothetical protein
MEQPGTDLRLNLRSVDVYQLAVHDYSDCAGLRVDDGLLPRISTNKAERCSP